jgi:predicted lipoprotein with Yx(FWY)xxD motif/plastocyanin
MGVTIQLGQTADLGEFLVDGEGMTLYLFTRDTPNTSTCYDDCALSWPPLLAEGEPSAGPGVDAALLGFIQRTDGTSQVTYNGWPLYYFATDMQPGDTAGQDVNGVWFVVSAAGEQIPPLSGADNSNTNSNTNSNDSGNANDDDNSNVNGNSAVLQGAASVDISGFAFDASPLTVKVGTTVTWENKDSAQHTVTADGGEFDSGTLRKGGEFSFTFTKARTYLYYCAFHGGPGGSGMSGQVIVVP